tara:strand:- start:8962 stop:9075 length:114 start_codon:yes stop_codon:yes gene_type:complete
MKDIQKIVPEFLLRAIKKIEKVSGIHELSAGNRAIAV